MARLRLIRSHEPQALLEAAASGFLTPAVGATAGDAGTALFPSPDYLLVLRQGGFRDDLLRIAAQRGVPGWFDPPLCLFQQMHEWIGQTDRMPCGDYERVVLLSRLLRESDTRIFSRLARPSAFVDALDRLFGELIAEGVAPAAFAGALERRADRDAFEVARDADLAALYDAYLATLAAARRRDGRDRLIDCAQAARSDSGAFAERMNGRREIRILGLQDLRGGWRSLLDALRASSALDEIRIYSCVALDTGEGLELDAVEWLDPGDSAATGRRLRLISSPELEREVEAVAERVRALLDAGEKPDRIAIVSRSARPFTDRVLDSLARYRVPATARRRFAFAEIPVVRAVLALFAVAAEGWTRYGLVELAEQPYFGRLTAEDSAVRRLDAVVLNHIGYKRQVVGLDAWTEAHRSLHDTAQEREARLSAGEEVERSGRDTPPPAWRVADALAAFLSFAEQVRELERSRPPAEWVAWLREFLETDPWKIETQLYRVPEDRWDVARVDAAGWRGMGGIIDQWAAALEAWPGEDAPIDVVAFESLLREMLSGDAALWTRVRRGVQVIEGLAAVQRSFEHVFIIGLSADAFPLRSPRSPILDERDRRGLAGEGLPLDTRDIWERREHELFRVLVAGATRSVTLSWARSDAEGRRVSPSIFIDQAASLVDRGSTDAEQLAALVAGLTDAAHGFEEIDVRRLESSQIALPTLAWIDEPGQRAFAAHALRIERVRASREPSPYNGQIEDPGLLDWLAGERLGEATFTWSATQIEAYAKCPWSWFSQRFLRLEDLDDPDLDMDPLVRGSILHDALRRFWERAAERADGPLFLRQADKEWALPMMWTAAVEAIVAAGSTAWLGAPALHETRRAELERMLTKYLEWEIDYNEKQVTGTAYWKKRLRMGVERHELAFGQMREDAGEDVVLDLGGVRFRLRGSIDRVDRCVDDRIPDAARFLSAIDYKTSKYSTPGGGNARAWEDGVVLQIPLYARVLETLNPGAVVSRVEYRAIKQHEVVLQLELYQMTKNGLVADDDQRARMEAALAAAGRHVADARAGRFPADPAPSCMCPPYCHAWDICRVAGGPESKW